MKTLFTPIDYDYFDYEGKNYLKIYGRDNSGKKLCIIDTFNPYFWAILEENTPKKRIQEIIEEIKLVELDSKGRKTKVEKVEFKEMKFLGKDVKALKINATNYKDLYELGDKFEQPEIIKKRGADLGLVTSYLIEKKLKPHHWYEIEGEVLHSSQEFGGIDNILEVDFVIKLQKKKEIKKETYIPLALAYDIETDSLKPEKGEILMISLVSDKFKKVITWKKSKTDKKYVEFVKDEKELLQRFIEIVKEISPDFLIGYHSDIFDLPFIKKRAKINRINLSLGLDSSEPKISNSNNPTAKISGITHIDLLKFIRTAYAQYMQSETLSLNEVSKEFLQDNKKAFEIKHSSKLKIGEWDKYYEYNLHDSYLTLELYKKFWPDILEFSRVIEEPVYDITRNGLSKQIESYILHNLEKFNEIPERRPGFNETELRNQRGSSEGAFVYEPKPGLYENLAMFDFTSMHTSIIITHNLSKGTLTNKKNGKISSPEIEIDGKIEKFYFEKKPGFFPLLLKEIFEKRKWAKEEYNKNPNPITKARSNAFKVLSASAHGYVAFSGARYYSWQSSNTILAFVRQYNKEIIKKIEKEGLKVIYGDTDSVAFTRERKSKTEIKELLKKLNDSLPGVMHLELEDFFKRGLWVTTRSGKTGAKKKYAMIDEKGKVKIRGFETVRRDWCKLARVTQDKILRLILESGDEKKALEYVKEIIEKLQNRKIERDQLIIRSQLKKPLESYKAISPHVVAAQKMKEKGENIELGSLIEYYIAESNTKSKLVRDKVKLPEENGKYDIEYYLDKQIIPPTENIFQVFKINIKEIASGKKQENLNKWF